MTTQKRKLLGKRNGLNIYSTLKSKSKLTTKKSINKVSGKQKIKNSTWKMITDKRCIEVNFICEWCGKPGTRTDYFNPLDGHHIDGRGKDKNVKSNCYIAHRATCHSVITDNNIDVRKYPNKLIWEKKNE